MIYTLVNLLLIVEQWDYNNYSIKTYVRDIAGVIHDYGIKERLKTEQSTAAEGLFIMEEGTIDAPGSCLWNINQWPPSCMTKYHHWHTRITLAYRI